MKTQSKKKIQRLQKYYRLKTKMKQMSDELEELRLEILEDMRGTGKLFGGGYDAFIVKERFSRILRKELERRISEKTLSEVTQNEERIKLYVRKGA
jgi:hypothetical protein